MEDAGLNTTKPDFKDATRTKRMPACSRNRTCLRMPALINIGGWKDGRREFCKEEPRFRIGWISEDHKKEKLRFVSGGPPIFG
ncbi:unnamed protein product [Rhizophagus irregularis]|nr:unnamed protein product [Rhizophagus irregularis]